MDKFFIKPVFHSTFPQVCGKVGMCEKIFIQNNRFCINKEIKHPKSGRKRLFVVEKPVGIVDNFIQIGLWKTKNPLDF